MDVPIYRKVGRGGAGNYYVPDSSTTKSEVCDLESQAPISPVRPRPTSSSSANTTASSRRLSTEQPAYTSSGRGGAGNVLPTATTTTSTALPTASELLCTTSANPELPSVANSDKTDINKQRKKQNRASMAMATPRPPIYTGRGGAGNMLAMQEYRKQQEERRKVEQEKKWREVERDVELGLMKPVAARLERERVE